MKAERNLNLSYFINLKPNNLTINISLKPKEKILNYILNDFKAELS